MGHSVQNTTIRQETDIHFVTLQAEKYKERWKEYVSKMQMARIPKQALKYEVFYRSVFFYLHLIGRGKIMLSCVCVCICKRGKRGRNLTS